MNAHTSKMRTKFPLPPMFARYSQIPYMLRAALEPHCMSYFENATQVFNSGM